MIFSSKATAHWQRAKTGVMAVVFAGLLGACGGGTSQLEPFIAHRVFAFGDDASALRSDGKRYGVNGVNATSGAFDCSLEPLWVQVIAGYYGLVFAECNTSTPPLEPKAFMRAAAGARVAELAAQVDAEVAAGGLRDQDLALVTAGANDVLELYAQYPTLSEASLLAEARARGERLAAVVNRLVNLGAKVIVANLPDMGMTPYARAEALAHAGSGFDRAAFMTRLSTAFNERLGVSVVLDGRYVGLAQMDLRSQAARISPQSFGLVDVSTAVCVAALPNCSTATLVAGATAASYLWADGTRMAPGGQSILTTLGLERARRNPF